MRRVALVAAFRDGLLLMGKRRDNGRWTMPGGHLEDDEDPKAGALRELREETGLAPDGDLKLLDEREVGELKLYTFKCKVSDAPSGKNDPDQECGVWAFFDISKGIPKDVAENMAGPKDPDKNVALDEFGLAKMAIADIPKGKLRRAKTPEPGWKSYDYSHVLSPEQRAAGYSMTVRHGKFEGGPARGVRVSVLHPSAAAQHHGNFGGMERDEAGFTSGLVEHGVYGGNEAPGIHVKVGNTYIGEPKHRHQGLGAAMYEALFAHAKHAMGVTHASSDEPHSSSAHRVHESLARKHGLGYNAKPHSHAPEDVNEEDKPYYAHLPVGDYDDRYGPYSYALKAEPRPSGDPPRTMWYVPFGEKEAQPIHGPDVVRFEDHGADEQGRLTTIHMQDGSKLRTRESVPLLNLRLNYIQNEGLGKTEELNKALFQQTAFRHHQTGKVIPSGGMHDLELVPKDEYGFYDTANWEDGFLDHKGNFFNRAQAAALARAPEGESDTFREVGAMEGNGYEKPEPVGKLRAPRKPPQADPRQLKMFKAEMDEVDRMLMHPDVRERRMALKLRGVDERHLVRALRDQDPEVQRAAFAHSELGHAGLLALMQMPDQEHLQHLALQHPRVDRAHVEALYHTHKARPLREKAQILRAISHHPHLDGSLIEKMVGDGNGAMVVDNLNTPAHVVRKLIEEHLLDPAHPDKRHLARRALRHPHAPPELVERAFKESPLDVKIAIAQSQHMPEALAHDVLVRGHLPSNDHEAFLRTVIISNPKASARHIAQATKDSSAVVRAAARGLANNPVRKFEDDHTQWLGEQLAKAVQPIDFAGIVRGTTPHGRDLVDHKPELTSSPPEHQADVQAYRQAVLAGPATVKKSKHELAGISKKIVYELPASHPTHAGQRFMVKPYNEKIAKRVAKVVKHPHLGWSEMTNQALYHAAGVGHLHQKVHVAEHRMGHDLPAEPALVVSMEKGAEPLGRRNIDSFNSPRLRQDARRVALFDFLNDNGDRHSENILISPSTGRLLAIDHSLGFQYTFDRRSPWQKRKDQPKQLNTTFGAFLNGSALTRFTGRLDLRDPEHTQHAAWGPTFDWWENVAPRVKEAMAKRLEMIKDPHVRDHIARNFATRARYLDDLARFGVENHGEDWHNQEVPVYRPGELTDDEMEDRRRMEA